MIPKHDKDGNPLTWDAKQQQYVPIKQRLQKAREALAKPKQPKPRVKRKKASRGG